MLYMRQHRGKLTKFEHTIVVEDCDQVEFQRMKDWLKINVPASDRRSPRFVEPTFDPNNPTKLVFQFRTEEQAMAFKLVK